MSRHHIIEWIKLVAKMQRQHPEQRKGQVIFNTLYDYQPKLADEIRGSIIDPFYSDERISDCIKWASQELMKMTEHQTVWKNKGGYYDRP